MKKLDMTDYVPTEVDVPDLAIEFNNIAHPCKCGTDGDHICDFCREREHENSAYLYKSNLSEY